MVLQSEGAEPAEDEIEIERDQFVSIMLEALRPDVEFLFNNSIVAMHETEDAMEVRFADGTQQDYHLVFGCDGMHSGVRRLWFGAERDYAHFLKAYFSLTIVNKLLVTERTMQMYNVPDKAVMLNAYNGKTDIIFCFNSEAEIAYDYRNAEQQKQMIQEQFAEQGWRTEELLTEVQQSNAFYFDKFCQIKMPSWTKGRVALVGDAGYCASPAAGMGASLSMNGAAAVADALEKHEGNFEAAFKDYNDGLRPFIEEVQAMAERNVRENFIPRTEEAIRDRNMKTTSF